MIKNLLKTKIETNRLLLIPISMNYINDIFNEFTDKITIFMYPKSAKDIKETEFFIKKSIKGLKDGSNLQLVILNKKTKEFLGCAGLHNIDCKTPELGIWIKKIVHGNAFGKEAITAMKEWADDNLVYEYILYPAASENLASRRIPEALGGVVVREYDQKNMSGNLLHFVEYRIYKDDDKR